MRQLSIVVGLAAALALTASSVDAQIMKKGVLTGRILSAARTIPAGQPSSLFSTPSLGDGVFIVTQFCQSSPDVVFSSDNVDPVPTYPGPNGGCTTFTPGIALQPGVAILCTNNSVTEQSCAVTGIHSPK